MCLFYCSHCRAFDQFICLDPGDFVIFLQNIALPGLLLGGMGTTGNN